MVLALFKLCLTIHCVAGERKGLKAIVFDRLLAKVTNSVSVIIDPFEGFVNLVKRPLLLGEHAEGEVTIVGIATCIGLMHAEGGSFTAGVEVITGNAPHGIQEGVLELKETLALFGKERGEL